MSVTTGCAAASPLDYVLRFIEDIADPNVCLRTEHRQGSEDNAVWATTSWGDAGKAAILEALRKSLTQ